MIFGFFWIIFGTWKWFKFRIQNEHKKINWYRWLFWIAEIAYVPILFNLSWSADCQFYTMRKSLTILPCSNNQYDKIWFILKAQLIWSFLLGVTYNTVLLYIIQSNKISTDFHEQNIEKKEIEFVLKLDHTWSHSYLFTYSSFRNGFANMYHRVVFNIFFLLLISIEVIMVSSEHY